MAEPIDINVGKSIMIVALEEVSKQYGRRLAVDKLSLTVQAGEVFGLVGANGGGKTTTLRMLAGVLKPDQGSGQVLGFDLLSGTKAIRQKVGYLSQRFSLYADLSVFENLRFRAEVYGLDRPRRAVETIIEDFKLTPYTRCAARRLSGGWARRLQLAACLIHSPRLILLDEPTAGLDALSRQEVWQRIGDLAAQGAAIVVSTHDLAEAERCSAAALLSEGRVVAVGTPDQIARNAPASAFLLSGIGARLLAKAVEELPGIIATYPQGLSLRIVADANVEEPLYALARSYNATATGVATRLEDAVLAHSERRFIG
jgi:ABC-2 type transport system ATP-binding protein